MSSWDSLPIGPLNTNRSSQGQRGAHLLGSPAWKVHCECQRFWDVYLPGECSSVNGQRAPEAARKRRQQSAHYFDLIICRSVIFQGKYNGVASQCRPKWEPLSCLLYWSTGAGRMAGTVHACANLGSHDLGHRETLVSWCLNYTFLPSTHLVYLLKGQRNVKWPLNAIYWPILFLPGSVPHALAFYHWLPHFAILFNVMPK